MSYTCMISKKQLITAHNRRIFIVVKKINGFATTKNTQSVVNNQLEQRSAFFWSNSLNLLKKNYFWLELSIKKSFVGQIGLEGLHWRVKTNFWKHKFQLNKILCVWPASHTQNSIYLEILAFKNFYNS